MFYLTTPPDFHIIGYWMSSHCDIFLLRKSTVSHRLLFLISNKGSFFSMHFLTDRAAHTTAFDGPVMAHWLKQKITQTANASAIQYRSDMQEDPNLYSSVLYCLSYLPPPYWVFHPSNMLGHFSMDIAVSLLSR